MVKQRPLPKVNLGESDIDSAMFDDLAGKPESRMILLIDPDLIDPSPQQTRTIFDPNDIQMFANVMRDVGFTSVIWVRPHLSIPGRYILIYGERRLRAAKEVIQDAQPKFTKIPCEIRADIIDPELLEFLGFFENNQRQALPPYDEAVYYRKLLARRDGQGKLIYTIEKLAARAHVTENHLRDRLFLLDLPEDALEAYKQNPHIALRSLREVCRLENVGQRVPWLALLVQNNISREDLRQSVQAILDGNYKTFPSEASETTSPQEEAEKTKASDEVNTSTFTEEVQKEAPRNKQGNLLPSTGTVPLAEPVLSQNTHKNGSSAQSEEYRKGQLQSFKIMVSRDTKNFQAILARWVGFLDQDEEVAEIFREGLTKVVKLFLEIQQITENGDTPSH